jgi:hypothetical protein
VRKGEGFGRALLVETVATVTAVVLPVGECEGGPTPHTNIGVDPFRGLSGVSISTDLTRGIRETYRVTVDHAAGNSDSGRKLVTLPLQGLVHLSDITEFVTAFRGCGPQLNELEYFGAHFGVHGTRTDRFEKRHQALHKLSRGYLGEKVGTTIFNAGIGELPKLAVKSARFRAWSAAHVQRAQLGIRIPVVDALFQRTHGFFRLYRLGSDNVGNLEVESNVFTAD